MSENIIQVNNEFIHTELKNLVRKSVEETLNALLDCEADQLVNAERYSRNASRQGYRSGHYSRKLVTTAGEIDVKIPKLKKLAVNANIYLIHFC